MRIIVFYDLPSVENYEKKEYTKFRNQLLRNGYVMMQFSIYIKCVNAPTLVDAEIKKLEKITPDHGNIRILTVTEKQYMNIKIILGHKKANEIYNNKERYIKI